MPEFDKNNSTVTDFCLEALPQVTTADALDMAVAGMIRTSAPIAMHDVLLDRWQTFRVAAKHDAELVSDAVYWYLNAQGVDNDTKYHAITTTSHMGRLVATVGQSGPILRRAHQEPEESFVHTTGFERVDFAPAVRQQLIDKRGQACPLLQKLVVVASGQSVNALNLVWDLSTKRYADSHPEIRSV